jgi:hypothetical protein
MIMFNKISLLLYYFIFFFLFYLVGVHIHTILCWTDTMQKYVFCQRVQFQNEKSAKFQNRTWSVFYGPCSYIQTSNAGPTDGWKWVKVNAFHDKVINICSISWYNYPCWFSLRPWIANSVRMNRLSSPNTHQSLYIASDNANTIYLILLH